MWRGKLVALAVTAVALSAAPWVGPPPAAVAADVGASTSPAGARVTIGLDGAYVEQPAPGAVGGPGAGGGCVRRWVPETGLEPGVADYLSLLFGPPPSPEHEPFSVYCGDAFLGTAWILPVEFTVVAAGPTAGEIAAALARDLPYPQVTVAADPSGRGLTGLPTWFWVEGYDGAPIVDSVAGLGATVEVEARATDATWSFGDGVDAVSATIPGRQGAPSVTHTYETRGPDDGYPVTVSFTFAVRYRVDGGPWIDLPPVARDAAVTYAVVESRAQLVPTEPGTGDE